MAKKQKNTLQNKPAKNPAASTPPEAGNIETTLASGASIAAPVEPAGPRGPAKLYRFEFRDIKNGKSGQPFWIEVKAINEADAWKQVHLKKVQDGLTEAEYSGRFEVK